jgi:hypothetical protein
MLDTPCMYINWNKIQYVTHQADHSGRPRGLRHELSSLVRILGL